MKANYTQMDPAQLHRIRQRQQLMQWRFRRTKNYAQKTGQTLEEAIQYIRHRCSGSNMATAVDELVQELDAVVDAAYHSSKEPVIQPVEIVDLGLR